MLVYDKNSLNQIYKKFKFRFNLFLIVTALRVGTPILALPRHETRHRSGQSTGFPHRSERNHDRLSLRQNLVFQPQKKPGGLDRRAFGVTLTLNPSPAGRGTLAG